MQEQIIVHEQGGFIMIVIRNGALDIESVKKVFSKQRHCFQYFDLEEDGTLYPVDQNSVAGEAMPFCIEVYGHEDTFYHLHYDSIIYGKKKLHVFQDSRLDMEILIAEQKGEYSLMDIRSMDQSIYNEEKITIA